MTAVATPQSELLGPPADAEPAGRDDSLALLFGRAAGQKSLNRTSRARAPAPPASLGLVTKAS